MKEISVFDVIGPNMIGPSSSHTAGALRIARVAGGMVGGEVAEATFTLYGSFARTYKGHGSDRALVAGIMGMDTEDLRIRDALTLADKKGLSYKFIVDDIHRPQHPNTVDIEAVGKNGHSARITGVSVGGGAMLITAINGVEVSFNGEYHTMIVEQVDAPGTVQHISTCLADRGINIAFMKLYREGRGQKAYTVVEADEPIDEEVLKDISRHPSVKNASIIAL